MSNKLKEFLKDTKSSTLYAISFLLAPDTFFWLDEGIVLNFLIPKENYKEMWVKYGIVKEEEMISLKNPIIFKIENEKKEMMGNILKF